MLRGSGTTTSIAIQDRDIALLRGLFESRLMTLDHVAALHFDGKREMAKKRVQKLKAAGLLAERPRHASEPSVLFLTSRALTMLQDHGQLSGFPKLSRNALLKRAQVSDMTLQHELQVMSVKAALVSAIGKTERFRVAEFSTWPLLHQFTVRRSEIDPAKTGEIVVKPDSFIRIHEDEPDGGLAEHVLFLEVDRSNESQEKLAEKAASYLAYYRSGGLAERLGGNRSQYQEFPFRVLFVVPSIERRNNTAARLLLNRPPTLTQVLLSTMPEAAADPLGPIWIRPKDYRDAAQDATDRRATGTGRSTRNERNVTKLALL
jgi:hypothetical protein